MVTINIKSKDLYFISAVFILLIGSGIVIAYNSDPMNPTVPSDMGHTIDEIEVVNESGSIISLDNYIRAVVQEEIGGIPEDMACSATAAAHTDVVYSMPSYRYLNVSIPSTIVTSDGRTLPTNCTTNDMDGIGTCVIKEIISTKNGPVKTNYCIYYQNATSNSWACLDTGKSGKNGDGTATHILPAVGNIWLRDDYFYNCAKCTREKVVDKWVLTDMDTNRGVDIYICVKSVM